MNMQSFSEPDNIELTQSQESSTFCPRTAWRSLPFCTLVVSSYTSSSLHTPDRIRFSSPVTFSRGALPQDCCFCRTCTDIQCISEAYIPKMVLSRLAIILLIICMQLTRLLVYLNSVSIPETSLHLMSCGPLALVLRVYIGAALLQLRVRLSSKQRRRRLCIVDLTNLR